MRTSIALAHRCRDLGGLLSDTLEGHLREGCDRCKVCMSGEQPGVSELGVAGKFRVSATQWCVVSALAGMGEDLGRSGSRLAYGLVGKAVCTGACCCAVCSLSGVWYA